MSTIPCPYLPTIKDAYKAAICDTYETAFFKPNDPAIISTSIKSFWTAYKRTVKATFSAAQLSAYTATIYETLVPSIGSANRTT